MTDQEHHENKQKASLSIKKAQGILLKVMQMNENDEYCPEIIQQVDAAIGLLESSKKTLLKGHLNHCLVDKMQGNQDQTIKELIQIFDLR